MSDDVDQSPPDGTPGADDENTERALQQVAAEVGKSHARTPRLRQSEYRSQLEQVHIRSEAQIVKLQGRWSWVLITWISLLILFQITLTFAVGFKWTDYKDHQTFLSLVIGQNIVQIVGMAFIVVKFLYPSTGARRILPD